MLFATGPITHARRHVRLSSSKELFSRNGYFALNSLNFRASFVPPTSTGHLTKRKSLVQNTFKLAFGWIISFQVLVKDLTIVCSAQ